MTIYIPPKLKIGFQPQTDTYEGKLAYIIYYDHKGVLHKETSWLGWCDSKIKPIDWDNEPLSGFVLNKGVTHWEYNRNMIRIFDPRGAEFEISPDNLVSLLMDTTCDKREIIGNCIYAWESGKLLLVSCSSEIYREATKDTKRKLSKFSARDLKPGITYTLKNGNEETYIGRFFWRNTEESLSGKKKHIFCSWGKWSKKYEFSSRSDAGSIAYASSEEQHPEFADMLKWFSDTKQAQQVVGFKTTIYEPMSKSGDYYYPILCQDNENDPVYSVVHRESYHILPDPSNWRVTGTLDPTKLKLADDYTYEAESPPAKNRVHLYLVLENEKTVEVARLTELEK